MLRPEDMEDGDIAMIRVTYAPAGQTEDLPARFAAPGSYALYPAGDFYGFGDEVPHPADGVDILHKLRLVSDEPAVPLMLGPWRAMGL